ncbi:hypothetical protein, partial [Paratractidigestivibacter sp.]|uniref:hypothetical protein n=1 Tax=Paratractidigestivibacter sp. TaxID=2847316 RepID=UPI002ACB16F7
CLMIARAADEAAAAAGLSKTHRDAVLLVDVITGLPDSGAAGEEEGFFVVARRSYSPDSFSS